MIEEFSRGWPIVVMMLYTIARRGRLAKYVQERQDSADLYGYLASEVYRFLSDDQRSVLEAAAAIPDARESDLTTLFGARTVPALEALESETPFVVRRPDGRIEVHPALREALADRTDSDVVLERLYTELDRSDGGVRAAQIALHRRRLDDAAAAIAGAAGPYLVSTPSAEVNHIISVIPEDVAYRYPALWSAVAVARGSRDIVAYIEAGERLFETLDSTTPPDVRIGLYSALTNCYLNRGRFKDAEVLARRFRETMEDEPVASMLISFWKTVLSTYRGQHLDVELFGWISRRSWRRPGRDRCASTTSLDAAIASTAIGAKSAPRWSVRSKSLGPAAFQSSSRWRCATPLLARGCGARTCSSSSTSRHLTKSQSG